MAFTANVKLRKNILQSTYYTEKDIMREHKGSTWTHKGHKRPVEQPLGQDPARKEVAVARRKKRRGPRPRGRWIGGRGREEEEEGALVARKKRRVPQPRGRRGGEAGCKEGEEGAATSRKKRRENRQRGRQDLWPWWCKGKSPAAAVGGGVLDFQRWRVGGVPAAEVVRFCREEEQRRPMPCQPLS